MLYISLENLRTVLQVIRLIGYEPTFTKYGRPCALATNDPKRFVQSVWKNQHCRQIEAEMRAASAAKAASVTEATL